MLLESMHGYPDRLYSLISDQMSCFLIFYQ